MLRLPLVAGLAGVCALAACSPTFNWREVRVEPTGLRAMLPCKPEKGSRPVSMGERSVDMHVVGCETGGATYAVMHADIGDAAGAGEVLQQWRAVTIKNMRGAVAKENPFVPPGATGLAQSTQFIAAGQRPDGSPVEGHAGYFAKGSRVFQAVVYAGKLKAEMTESFFSGLAFQ